jgi:multicomponent Na+:H+ antiporter subunit G
MNSSTIVTAILLIIGIMFNLFGCIGLIRLPDVYNRLQAATKCVTLGSCSIMLSLVFYFGFNEAGIKGIISIPIIFFASTVAAHALVRGSYHFGVKLGEGTIKDDYKETAEQIAKIK